MIKPYIKTRTLILEIEVDTNRKEIDWDNVLKNCIHDTNFSSHASEGLLRTRQLSREWEESKHCTWKLKTDEIYETECGNLFILNESTFKDNNMKYCCYCGREINEPS